VSCGDGLDGIPEILSSFPPSLGPDERLWASGPYIACEFRPLGDGTWQTSNTFVAGTGTLGLSLAVGSLVAGAVSRSKARDRAAADAVARWVPAHQGQLFVSGYGFYFHTPQVFSWRWSDIDEATVTAAGETRISGHSTRGPTMWAIASDWAELVFVLWALARHPRHPQLVNGEWLPPGWLEHARACQRPAPVATDGRLLPGPGGAGSDAGWEVPDPGASGSEAWGPESVGRPGGPPYWPPPPGWKPPR
jgi:hypothetical protein